MAKPGSQLARDISAGAVDLSTLKPEVKVEIQKQAEARMHLRCFECGRRIGAGFKFSRIDVQAGEAGGPPVVNRLTMAMCAGDEECEGVEKARVGSTLVEIVEYVWIDGGDPAVGDPAPGAAVVASDG